MRLSNKSEVAHTYLSLIIALKLTMYELSVIQRIIQYEDECRDLKC